MKLIEIEDVKTLQKMVDDLWKLLDNIDTIGDMARSNDKAFRNMTEKQQRKRFDVLTSDGYDLFLPKGEE